MSGTQFAGLPGNKPFKERHSIADQITDTLRDSIRNGTLADGTELNQVALSKHFGVSRVPVREALRALEVEGWITAPTHYRALVQGLSVARIEEIFELRTLIEVHLIGKAVPNTTSGRIADLKARCSAMDRIRDHDEWLSANRAFHRALLEPSGSDMMIDMLEQLSAQPERYLQVRNAGQDRQTVAGAEHRAIVAAAAKGDVVQARKLIRAHIAQTRAAILAAVSILRSAETQREKR
ncbi:MAG: GntR family transcriptional regulator [Thermomicrobiales bacterium]